MTINRKSARNMRPSLIQQAGLTLVELMVAMLLGLFIAGGSLGLFVTNKAVYTDTGRNTELQDNARFAQQYLTDDIRHSFLFGGATRDTTSIRNALASANASIAGYCTEDSENPRPMAGAFSLGSAVYGTSAVSGEAIRCIADAAQVSGLPSDVLIIKMVDREPLDTKTALTPGSVYLTANTIAGDLRLFSDSSTAMPVVSKNCKGLTDCYPYGLYWRFLYHVYYIRDANPLDDQPPTLSRKTLQWTSETGMTLEVEDLVEGVEAMRVQFGVRKDEESDTDTILHFYSAANVPDIEWENQRFEAVRVALLLRSLHPDRSYSDTSTYVLGDVEADFATGSFATNLSQGAELRNFHRRVITDTIWSRNRSIIE